MKCKALLENGKKCSNNSIIQGFCIAHFKKNEVREVKTNE